MLVTLALAAPRPASGQETREYELPELERPPTFAEAVGIRLIAANRFVGRADYGSFSTTAFHPEGRLRIQVPLSKRAILRVLGRGRVLMHDFDGPSDLFGAGPSGGNPFGDLVSWTVRAQAGYQLPESWTLFSENERWALLGQGIARARYEAGSSVRHGTRGGGSFGFLYRLGDRFEGIAGITVESKLTGEGVSVGPFLEFDWRLNHAWRLKSYGVGLQLERLLGRELRLFVRTRLEGTEYRLAERGPGIGRGAVRVREVPVGLGVRWDFTRRFRLTLVAGAVAWSELRVEDADEVTLGRATAGPTPYVSLRLDVRR